MSLAGRLPAKAWCLLSLSGACTALLGGCAPPTAKDDSSASQADLVSVDPARELMITDLSVVEDPVRTTWTSNPSDEEQGAWTFGRLMANMSGTHSPSDYVLKWLKTWETAQAVNGFTVVARPNVRTLITNPWRQVSGCALDDSPCTLDFSKAPFRLLAVVNRPDLRTFADDRGGTAGQGRFVFGALRPDGTKLFFTVIFEYALLAEEREDIVAWANRWHRLSRYSFGSSYNHELRRVTSRFAGPDVAEDKPNGSALLQLRTNEVALGVPWQLREFNISGTTGYLELVTVKQTPDISFNNTQALADFINANATAINNNQSNPPAAMLGGSALTPGFPNPGPQDFVWRAPGVAEGLRHQFAIQTCNGCHLSETGTRFTHVKPRDAGVKTVLSDFLTQTALPARVNDMVNILTRGDSDDHDELGDGRD